MARRRKLSVPPDAQLEEIVWKDHHGGINGPACLDDFFWTTVGYNVFEDDKQILLISSIQHDWLDDVTNQDAQLDHTVVLKGTIFKRTPLGRTFNRNVSDDSSDKDGG